MPPAARTATPAASAKTTAVSLRRATALPAATTASARRGIASMASAVTPHARALVVDAPSPGRSGRAARRRMDGIPTTTAATTCAPVTERARPPAPVAPASAGAAKVNITAPRARVSTAEPTGRRASLPASARPFIARTGLAATRLAMETVARAPSRVFRVRAPTSSLAPTQATTAATSRATERADASTSATSGLAVVASASPVLGVTPRRPVAPTSRRGRTHASTAVSAPPTTACSLPASASD